jgi:hypothetical protein
MLILSGALMSVWMAFELLGYTMSGFTHLLLVGVVAIELLRHDAKRA